MMRNTENNVLWNPLYYVRYLMQIHHNLTIENKSVHYSRFFLRYVMLWYGMLFDVIF